MVGFISNTNRKQQGAPLRVHVHCSLFEGVLTGPAALQRNPNVSAAVFSLSRPIAAFRPPSVMLHCGPPLRTFAATAKYDA